MSARRRIAAAGRGARAGGAWPRAAARSPSPPTEAPRQAQARPRARLVPEPRPRGDLRGASRGATSRRSGLDVKPHVPSDPAAPIKQVAAGRADLAISYEPEVLLARAAGTAGGRGRGAGPAPADVADRDRGSRASARSRDLRGKRVGTAGIPYQSAYLKTILRRAQVPASSREGDQRGRQPAAGDALREGRRDARRLLERRGRRARQRGAKPGSCPVDRLGVPDYDELVLVANSDKLDDQRDDLRLFISAVARGRGGAARTRAARRRRCLTRIRDLKAKATARERARSRSRRCFPTSGQPVGLPGPGRLAQLRRLDGRQRRAEGACPTSERDHERPAAGPGPEVNAASAQVGRAERRALATAAGARRRGTTASRRRCGEGPCARRRADPAPRPPTASGCARA